MREVTEPHTRLLRIGLATSESREYWRHHENDVEKAFEERWFGSRGMPRVRYLLTTLADRFDAFPPALAALRRWQPDDDAPLVCHWHLQLSDPLYRTFTGTHLVERREHPEPTVDRNAAIRWLESQRDWAPSTVNRMVAGIMGACNDAGFSQGVATLRPLGLPKVSDMALAYLLYLLRETEFAGTLGQNPYLASVGLAGSTLDARLARLPGVQFSRLADISSLGFDHPSLQELFS